MVAHQADVYRVQSSSLRTGVKEILTRFAGGGPGPGGQAAEGRLSLHRPGGPASANPGMGRQASVERGHVCRGAGASQVGDARSGVGPRRCPDHTGPAGAVCERDRAGSAPERCGSHSGADERMVSHSRADRCGLCGLGASASRACPVFVQSAAEPECVPCPREAFARWLPGLS